MWKCKICQLKNNNSSEKCHTKNCKGIRETDSFEMPVEIKKEKPEKRVYDYCPVHQKDVIWIQGRWHGKKVWRCTHGGHKPAILLGKSKPFPIELMTEEERVKHMEIIQK